jgi:hypothetical protein
MESRHSNVTVIRVYPEYQPVFAAQASADAPASEHDLLWPDDLNGG